MISVVFSTRKDNQPHIDHIKKTSGLGKKIEVIHYVNDGEFGLTELYNKALKETTNNIVVFCHDDIIFNTKNWGRKLKSLFEKNPEYGIIGIAGTTDLIDGRWWTLKESMNGIVSHQHEGKKWTGPMQFEDPTGKIMMLPADMSLLEDPEFRKWVEAYAKDEQLFFKDFSSAFSKMMELGVKFD